ncbi:hypothetical protein BDR03DRAFT_1014367 [Suillus americanus]|nr:hypothetical protein BDR03DRAFT_1014367 [Suillus americanus]
MDSGSTSELKDDLGGSYTARINERHSESEDETNGGNLCTYSFWAVEDLEEDKSPLPTPLKYHTRKPVSLPPSCRAPQFKVQPCASSVQCSRSPPPALLLPMPPVTPPRKPFLHALPSPSNSKAKKTWPTQDSPDNPFLAAPVFEEKPMITHVFQGQKATFHNPQYHLTPEAIKASKLLIDHPDFKVG